MTKQQTKIVVQHAEITIISHNSNDFICLSDMAKGFDGGVKLIENWLRNKDSLEFLGLWEHVNNP